MNAPSRLLSGIRFRISRMSLLSSVRSCPCASTVTQFALSRGSRSGRVAWQFARHYAGGRALDATAP